VPKATTRILALTDRCLRLGRRGRRGRERRSYAGIAEQLNSEGKLTRYGKRWSQAAVFRVLSREE